MSALTFILPLKTKFHAGIMGNGNGMSGCSFRMESELFPGWFLAAAKIAAKTADLMRNYDAAIWAHHGMFATGETFDSTFGLMHTIEKAAEILIKVLSVRSDKRQTIEPGQFRQLAKEFHVELPERFLFDKVECKS